jgi:putative flippase GtrA
LTSKIDVRLIVQDHFATFIDEGTKKTSWGDIGLMIGLPICVALIAVLGGFKIGEQNIGTLISVFAIFAGLLFNVLVLIYSFSDGSTGKPDDVRSRLLAQCFANISYTILLALLTVVALTAMIFVTGPLEMVIEGMVVAAIINFLLSLLMVLKRMHVLLRNKFGS